jgi:hypothetical protein
MFLRRKKRVVKLKKSWEKLKNEFTDWRNALMDASREVQGIQSNIWFSVIVGLFSFVAGEIYGLLPNIFRKVIIPSILFICVGIYIVIVIAWAISLIEFRWLKSEWEHTREEAAKFCEIGEVAKKSFDYIIKKLDFLLYQLTKQGNLSTKIMFISPFDESSFNESKNLLELAKQYQIEFEWYITEKTPDNIRTTRREALQEFITQNLGCIYLTGELPIFDKLLVVPNITIIAFIGNVWFSWGLVGRDMRVNQIKEKIVLTPFPGKVNQFFGKSEVHRAISCYLSEVISMQGFLIGAEYPYLWIKKTEELFTKFTEYQKDINTKFREISEKLRPISKHITANLPLLKNYKAIIEDDEIKKWLTELKGEAINRNTQLRVDRYIYINGKYEYGKPWDIEKDYLSDILKFLQEDFFSDLTANYNIWVVLADREKLDELYKSHRGSIHVSFPFDDVVSNWIWFECNGGYQVLQYEMGLEVENSVADALAEKEFREGRVGTKEEAKYKFSKISLFMFADGVDPNSQDIMQKYNEYKGFLAEYRDESPLFLSLQEFLQQYKQEYNPEGFG